MHVRTQTLIWAIHSHMQAFLVQGIIKCSQIKQSVLLHSHPAQSNNNLVNSHSICDVEAFSLSLESSCFTLEIFLVLDSLISVHSRVWRSWVCVDGALAINQSNLAWVKLLYIHHISRTTGLHRADSVYRLSILLLLLCTHSY